LANIRSQIKRNRQNEKHRLRNRVYRGSARTFIYKARTALDSSNKEEAAEAVRLAVSALDKAAEKGVIHRNNASRRKGRLMKQLAQMEK
jgi:small subunit ribosomal protein S20